MTGEPSLCIKGCGFYSTSQTKNLCSKCYNDFLKDESAKYLASFTETRAEATGNAAEAEAAVETVVVTSKKKKSISSRCTACKRKVGLLGFQCRCGHVYCGSHRYPEEHSCPSDYKTASNKNLIVQNPIIKGDKLFRI